MDTLYSLRRSVFDWIEDQSEPELVNRLINRSIQTITMAGFSQLISKVEITPDSEGKFYLPALCRAIFEIYPKESQRDGMPDFVFYGTKRPEEDPRYLAYHYRVVGASETPLMDFTATMNAGSNVMSITPTGDGEISDDMIGEELIILGVDERFRIDGISGNDFTVYPKWNYSTSTDLQGSVRPPATQIIQLYKTDGTLFTEPVYVEFFRQHPQLVLDSDPLLVDATDAVVLQTVKFLLRQTKYDVDAQRLEAEYREAIAHAYAKQPAHMDLSAGDRDYTFSSPFRHC